MSEGAARMPAPLKKRYVPIQSLGRGGMGLVVRARDRQLKRDVAVKLMLALPSPVEVSRFQREAEMLAQVEHPGVVRVFDFGIVEGKPYLVMELLDGESLDKVREGVGLEGVAVGAAEALDAVHAAGLIHRDVKPANLFRCRGGRLVLTDFGLSHDPERTRLTATGEVSGTAAFLAPEAWKGGRPDPTWDWWALGATLYTLAEGRAPYRMGELIAGAAGEPLLRPAFHRLQSRPVRRLIRGLMDPLPPRRLAGAPIVRSHFADAAGSGLQEAIPGALGDSARGWGEAGASTQITQPVPAPPVPPPSRGWRGPFLVGAALALLATAPWWATSRAPAPRPEGTVSAPKPAWPHPFPRDLAARVSAELRPLEDLVVGPDLSVRRGAPGGEMRPLLDPDPLLWWPVVERLPSLRAALDWVVDQPASALTTEVRAVLAEADEALAGQALQPVFAVALEAPPSGPETMPWEELSPQLSEHPSFDGEPPAGPWLQRAVRAFLQAQEIVEARRLEYVAVGEGRPVSERFPRELVSSQSFALMPFREQVRRGFFDLAARRALTEWMAPAPLEVERGLWALGRAADAGQVRSAIKVAARLLGTIDEVASTRVLASPPEVFLGRRPRSPEGRYLALEVARITVKERRRAGIPSRDEAELASTVGIQRELPEGDWVRLLALTERLDILRETRRAAEAMALFAAHRSEFLPAGPSVWPTFEVLSIGARGFQDPAHDADWDEDFAAAVEAFLARPAVLRDDAGESTRSTFGDSVAARRARDPGFRFTSRFE